MREAARRERRGVLKQREPLPLPLEHREAPAAPHAVAQPLRPVLQRRRLLLQRLAAQPVHACHARSTSRISADQSNGGARRASSRATYASADPGRPARCASTPGGARRQPPEPRRARLEEKKLRAPPPSEERPPSARVEERGASWWLWWRRVLMGRRGRSSKSFDPNERLTTCGRLERSTAPSGMARKYARRVADRLHRENPRTMAARYPISGSPSARCRENRRRGGCPAARQASSHDHRRRGRRVLRRGRRGRAVDRRGPHQNCTATAWSRRNFALQWLRPRRAAAAPPAAPPPPPVAASPSAGFLLIFWTGLPPSRQLLRSGHRRHHRRRRRCRRSCARRRRPPWRARCGCTTPP